jgi:hypothetical protein
MPVDSRLINAFRRAFVMQAVAQDHTFDFNLNDTSSLLPRLSTCVQAQLSPSPQTTATVGSLRSDASRIEADDAALQMEAIQLATNFVLASGLKSPTEFSGVSEGGSNSKPMNRTITSTGTQIWTAQFG